MRSVTGPDLLAQMLAFEAAMLDMYEYSPARNPLLSADQHPDECYTSGRDCDRFVGWMLRNDLEVQCREPRNE
jgi:hypothetical protein